ncbi:MAG TPA: hypothetical protein VMA83_04890 [Solirubrobacteraceae bacterium]|nr:hypothetical protein [Solirubrobacteraceae bacterium]
MSQSKPRVRSVACSAAAVSAAVLALTAAPALATSAVYSNLPAPGIRATPSVGFDATQTSEFGGAVELAAGSTRNPTVTIVLTSWACQQGSWYADDCVSEKHAKFSQPVSVSLYNVEADGAVGSEIATEEQTLQVPYRPSTNHTRCTGLTEEENVGGWWVGSEGRCADGLNAKFNYKFSLSKLPPRVIVAVSFSSTPPRTGEACESTAQGCPFDSLNVAVEEGGSGPSVGQQIEPEDAYVKSTWEPMYGTSGTPLGTFGISNAEWKGYQPLFSIK